MHFLPVKLETHSSLSSKLPRDRSALDNAHDLTSKLAVDHGPPWYKGKLVALFDDGELAAR